MSYLEPVGWSLGIAAFITLGAVAHERFEEQARTQFNRCFSIDTPTTLDALERAFGPPERRLAREGGDESVFFEPTPLYWHFASGSIDATVRPPSTIVTSLHCGEGL